CNDEQVGALEVRKGIVSERPAGESRERLGGHELLGAARDERDDVVPCLDEETRELASLVGRDTAGDPEQDPRHDLILPAFTAPPAKPARRPISASRSCT